MGLVGCAISYCAPGTISTPRGYGLLLLLRPSPVAWRPVVLLAFLLNPFCQYTQYNLLSSKTNQSFPSDLYSTQYLVIFSEFCCFIAVTVIVLSPPFLPIGKLVSTLGWPGSHIGRHCIIRNVRDVTDSSRIRNEQNDGWQCHDKTCFSTPAAGSWTIIVTRPIRTRDSHLTRVCVVVVCEFPMCMHCIQLTIADKRIVQF
jgi:hypothetical protein